MKKILILEDEMSIRDFIVFNFKRAGYEVFEAGSGNEALTVFSENPGITLAVLDVMLPDIDGFEVCRKLRAQNKTMGIIMLSAKDLDEDVLSGFISGADDYIKKPVSASVLVAKVDALYRRISAIAAPVQPEPAKTAKQVFVLDEKKRSATKNGHPLDLTPNEYNILKYFIEHPDVVVTRDDILQAVWGYNFNGDADIVNVNITRLRKKIEDKPSKPDFLQTSWGKGYIWKTEQ
ncbi:MAG: response regulator transcription factor [Clostridia bacterium]|nr:response regulator transcription factor [Clostridia bacterium]MBO5298787.1 response regulator transcription factor [Clostridia bacterium]MBQ4628143.1 response regulator transcription factor [Clostridia bacterium]